MSFSFSQFSPYFGENFLVGLFSFLPTQPKILKKKFSFLFFLQSFPFIIFRLQTNTPLHPLSSISCDPYTIMESTYYVRDDA